MLGEQKKNTKRKERERRKKKERTDKRGKRKKRNEEEIIAEKQDRNHEVFAGKIEEKDFLRVFFALELKFSRSFVFLDDF